MNEEELMYESTSEGVSEEELDAVRVEDKGERITCTDDIYYDYVHTIQDFKPLTAEEVAEIYHNYNSFTREKLINHNLKLVVCIANKIKRHTTIDIMDLIQEGNLGLIKAVECFNLERGCAFSTYAYNWIACYMNKYIENNDRAIRFPSNIRELESKLRVKEGILNIHKDYYTIEELKSMLGITENCAKTLHDSIVMKSSLSLENNFDNDTEDGNIGDTIEQTLFDTPERAFEKKELLEILKDCIDTLLPSERYIIEQRYGLFDGGVEKSLQSIGDDLGVSRQRINQIEQRAIEKLRTKFAKKGYKINK